MLNAGPSKRSTVANDSTVRRRSFVGKGAAGHPTSTKAANANGSGAPTSSLTSPSDAHNKVVSDEPKPSLRIARRRLCTNG